MFETAVIDAPKASGTPPPPSGEVPAATASENQPTQPEESLTESPYEPMAQPGQFDSPYHQGIDALAKAAFEKPMPETPSITPETGAAPVTDQKPSIEVAGTPSVAPETGTQSGEPPTAVPGIVGAEGRKDPLDKALAPKPKRKLPFGRILTGGLMAASTLLSGNGAPVGEVQPHPAPYTEVRPMPSAEMIPLIVEKKAEPVIGGPQKLVDAMPPIAPISELACPATKEYVVQPGGSLSRGLIEVNGLGRYLHPDGTFNEEQIYKDLLCTIYLPENMDQLKESDPVLHAAIESLKANEKLTGPITPAMLREVVIVVNTPRRYLRPDGTWSNPQLGLTYAKDPAHATADKWTLPNFSGQTQGAASSSTPGATVS